MSKYPLQLTFSRRPSILHFKIYDNSHWDLAQCLCRHRSNKLAQLKTVITKHWETDTNTTLGNTVAEVKSCATYAWILLKTLNDEMKTDSFHGSKGKLHRLTFRHQNYQNSSNFLWVVMITILALKIFLVWEIKVKL